MSKTKRKAVLDDGCSPELVRGADFDGIFEIPIVKKPAEIFIPKEIVPFTERDKVSSLKETAIGFHEMDPNFAEILITPKDYILDFSRFGAIITPDCSLYRDAPLSVQITNVYRNRAIGYYYQSRGQYVIPQIRWGSEATYTTKVLPEKIAFLGVAKHSIVAIGTYGCIQHRDDKYHFEAGLSSMLETLEPNTILVYGSMPDSVFGQYLNSANFIQFDDWTKRQHAGDH